MGARPPRLIAVPLAALVLAIGVLGAGCGERREQEGDQGGQAGRVCAHGATFLSSVDSRANRARASPMSRTTAA